MNSSKLAAFGESAVAGIEFAAASVALRLSTNITDKICSAARKSIERRQTLAM